MYVNIISLDNKYQSNFKESKTFYVHICLCCSQGVGVRCLRGCVFTARRQGAAAAAVWTHGVSRLLDPSASSRQGSPLPLRQTGHGAG